MACVGNIAKAMGPAMESYVCGLLDVMFSAGPSPTLVEALDQITVRYVGSHDLVFRCFWRLIEGY